MKIKSSFFAVAIIFLFGSLFESDALAATDYSNALRKSSYRVFSGDINGDSQDDLLLRANTVIVPVDLDDMSLIVVPSPSPTFVLLSSADGTYSLRANPAAATLSSAVWKNSPSSLVFGKVQGNGRESMLIKGTSAGAPSFVIAISATGVPQILQQLTSASIGIDLGKPGTVAELNDNNSDGRTDLVVKIDGRVTAVLLADANGIFRKDEMASINAVWLGMLSELSKGNRAGAMAYISERSKASYDSIFSALGAGVKAISPTLTNFRLVKVTQDIATAVVTRNYNGKATMHHVTFIANGDSWDIMEF